VLARQGDVKTELANFDEALKYAKNQKQPHQAHDAEAKQKY
jgi:hypothetical protein